MKRISRRQFITKTVSLLGAASAISLFGPRTFASKSRIRHFWWGNPGRDKRTFGVISLFNKKNPDTEVIGETVAFADYFPKLSTQIAGRNMPDVIQQG